MESLRERRLAFRRKNTIRNGRSSLFQAPEFIPPTHPVHFQDRKCLLSEEKIKTKINKSRCYCLSSC